MKKKDLRQINEFLWEIPEEMDRRMLVPARIYASETMLEDILRDDSAEQLVRGAMLPGIATYAIAMPDCHQGYSVPIGFVGGTRVDGGVVSPGACGFDINCGMRLLTSNYTYQELTPYLDVLIKKIYEQVPSGLGKGRKEGKQFTATEIDHILAKGASYVVSSGFGTSDDLSKCENEGRLEWADPEAVSKQAKKRGRDQVGTLGSGNHFLEIQKVDKIFDQETASVFGLKEDQVTVMIHCGSRGLGHQVCSDYLRLLVPAQKRHGIRIPGREFVCAPFSSNEGQKYFSAMAAAANYAWANRQMISYFVRQAWSKALGRKDSFLSPVYDVAHNIIKKEVHDIEGKKEELLIHRKGATRAFPPGHQEIPEQYQRVGQPVLIPGSMGTFSYILAGQESGAQSLYSTSHGSGRIMSRNQAKRNFRGEEEVVKLKKQGIKIISDSKRGVAEEAPGAYKDINEVINIVDKAGLSRKVARLKPLAVIKGE